MFYFDIQNNFGTQHVLQMLRASEKDLPVLTPVFKIGMYLLNVELSQLLTPIREMSYVPDLRPLV